MPGPVARLASCFLAAWFALPSFAGTGTLTAQVAVDTFCSVATTGLAFGAYDPIVANVTSNLDNGGTASVTITCVKGSSATIALGNGSNFSSSTRHMQHAVRPASLLAYQLYQPSSVAPGAACTFPGTTPWDGTSLFTPGAAPNKNSRTFNVCGTVPAGQDAEAGAYSDTVVVTVNF